MRGINGIKELKYKQLLYYSEILRICGQINNSLCNCSNFPESIMKEYISYQLIKQKLNNKIHSINQKQQQENEKIIYNN